MKKTIKQRFFLSLCLLMLFSLFGGGNLAWAQKTETITLANGAYNNENGTGTIVWAGNCCTITQEQGSGSDKVNESYVSGPRWYAKHVITFAAKEGYTLTGVTIVVTDAKYVNPLSGSTYSSGASASASGKTVTITTSGDFTVTMSAQSRISSITVTYDDSGASSEKAPTISVQPVSAIYEQNATAKALTITASGDPTPTYQWYSNTENSNTNGTVLVGETGTSFTPATMEVGTMYYYCVATNSVGDATSDVAAVTVKEPFVGPFVTMSSADDADIKFVKGSGDAAGAVWAKSTPRTAKGITLSGDKGSTNLYSYFDGTVVRFYSGNNLTITPEEGITIEKIEIVRKSTTGDNGGTINCTGLTASGNNTTTNTNVYIGPATSAVTFTAATAQARFTEIKVYYTGGAAAYVEAPTLTVPAGTYFEAQTVKVNNYDSNLKYYYTTDTTEPALDASFQPTGTTQAYDNETGINISENTTLKILATDGNNISFVVTAVYTITTPDASSIMALRRLGPGTYNVSLTDAIVTYVNGKNAYIQDATGGLFIYTSHSLKAGEKVNGRVGVVLVDYHGTDEATTFDVSGATITSGNEIPVTTLTIADLLTGDGMKTYESVRVKIADATVTAAITGRTGTIVKGGNEIAIYEGFSNCLSTTCMTDVNAIANVIGYPTTYNKDGQLNQLKLWNASAVEETGYNLSVSAVGYATYFNSTKAYKLPASCVGYVWEDGKIVGVYKEKDNVVPANEPLVIQAAAGSYPLMFTTTSIPSDTYKSYGMNALEGTDEATAITPDPDYYFYGLSLNSSNDINSVGFYWMEADGAAFTNGAHKAYLKILQSEFTGQPVRGFAFKGTTTGVESVESSNNAPQAIYDLTGRRVSKAEKGIYIINGKKVIK